MRISVINFSREPDDKVQRVIRAVNRQLTEDFAPYWHRTGVLRLEGRPGAGPDIETTTAMRGDAVIYLQEEPDDDRALGYHDLNLRGVPYGFVFLALAREIGEDWSVTFSHEALELVMDPEANLLASGPHPEDPGRAVQHWYEVCDAVQDQTYAIDEVKVSNFVTPLYFTVGNEDGSRNDFLGASGRGRRPQLPSFGVAPGGYVGFLDPETGEHETFTARDRRAQQRLDVRNRAGWGRRGVRHQGEMSPDMVRRLVTGCVSGEPLPGPWFEGYAIDVRAREGDVPLDHLTRAAAKVIGESWHETWEVYDTTPADSDLDVFEYDLAPKRGTPPIRRADAFEMGYALAKEPNLVDVEPSFVYLNPDLDALAEIDSPRRASAAAERHLPQSRDPNWCRDRMNLAAAWQLTRGRGIRIGHPDTGYLRHAEIEDAANGGPVRDDLGWDFEDDDSIPHAELDEDNLLPGGPNHGTATASVIASASGGEAPGSEFVVGAAPEAEVVPIRVANSVVHFSLGRVRQAIRFAADNGCQVVSMSLGGPFPGKRLRREVARAAEKGVVVVSAAGNHVPFRAVVFPARYEEVVAVAASNAVDRPWSGSSRGPAVDITAPGESVYRALIEKRANGQLVQTSKRSSGTSYATAHIAGVCALWIAHHGHAALKRRYGASLPEAFRRVLRDTARSGDGMDAGDFVGIVDAGKVLLAPLPAIARRARRARTLPREDVLENFRALMPHLPDNVLRSSLAKLLNLEPARLNPVLREMGLEIAMQLATDQRLLRDFDTQARATGTLRRAARNSTTARTMQNLHRRFSVMSISDRLKGTMRGKDRARRGRRSRGR